MFTRSLEVAIEGQDLPSTINMHYSNSENFPQNHFQ